MENLADNKVESTVIEETVANANAPKDVKSKANANSTTTAKKTNQLVSITKMIEAGVHIGLNPRRWNPKMEQYIYAKRNNNHIINISKTLSHLNRAFLFLEEVTKAGGKVLLVGTNGELIKDLIQRESKRARAYNVTQRWLGGTLTNFKNISKSIKKLNDNIELIKSGEIKKYTKKEQIAIRKETDKLTKFYGGIKNMRKLPQAIVILDPVIDNIALKEANKLNIPVVALANTNADPSTIDYLIPSNNNSYKTIWLILSILVDAIAIANNETPLIVGKADEQIEFPEFRKKREFNNQQQKSIKANIEVKKEK